MGNPERPRVQAAKPVQEETKSADLTHADWSRLDEVWNQPTVVDGKAKLPTTPSDTHDDTAMLDRARAVVIDPRRADQKVAQVYAAQDAEARAAQVGDRVDMAHDLPDAVGAGESKNTFDPGVFSDDDGPIALPSDDQGDVLSNVTGSFSTPADFYDDPTDSSVDDPTEMTPLDRNEYVYNTPPPSIGDVQPSAGMRSAGTPAESPVVERTSSRRKQAEAPVPPRTPIVPGSINDITNITRAASRKPAPKTETIAITPEPPVTNWFGKKVQAALDTVTRWGRRLGLIAALSVPTNQAPQEAVSAHVVEKPQASPVTDRPTIVVPRVDVAPSTLSTTPIQQPRSPERVSSQRVVAPPENLPVAARNTVEQKTQLSVATKEDAESMRVEPTMPPVPVVPPNVDVEAPKTVTPAVEVPVAPADVAKQLNAEMSKGALSPEKQIDYVKSLFDSLDSSKVFIRLSPTKRLELRQSASGDIVARFPGEKDFRPLTSEDVSTLGKDLSRQPHYTR